MTIVGLLALGVAALILVGLHVVGRSLSPVQRTISEYVLLGRTQRLLFAGLVGCVALAAVAVLVLVLDRPVAVVALAVFAAGYLVTGIFATDEIDPAAGEFELTGNGRVHTVAALGASAAIIVAGFAVGPVGPVLPALVPWLPALGGLAFLLTLVLRGPLSRLTGVASVHGVGERILLLADMAWLAIVLLAHP